jgi:hypothetical protein
MLPDDKAIEVRQWQRKNEPLEKRRAEIVKIGLGA